MWMDIAQEGDNEPRSDEEDTVYDRTNPFHTKNSRGENETESDLRVMAEEQETRCGIGSWRPLALQKFSTRPVFSIVFTIVGVVHCSFWTYYTANISTYEKRFRMDSITSGVLLIANELSQILFAIIFTYFPFRRHRAKLLTIGVAMSSLSCFLMASPHFFMGSGEMVADLMIQKPTPSFNNQHPTVPKPLKMVMESEILTTDPTFGSTISNLLSSDLKTESQPNASMLAETATGIEDFSSISAFENLSSLAASIPSSSLKTSPTPFDEIAPTSADTAEEDHTDVQALLPFINDEMKSLWPMCNRHTETVHAEEKNKNECSTKQFERKLTFGFLFCANFLGGLGSMLYLLSGGPFAEDSTILPNELPRIFGITMAVRLIGGFFGYLFAWSCLTEFVNPFEEITQIDSRWIGGYWLGWTLLGMFMAIFTVIFSLFPRQAPKEFLKKRSLTHETGLAMYLIPNTVSFFGGSELKTANPFPSIMNIPNAIQGLTRNKVYVLLTLSTMTHIFFSVGFLTFLPKYLETVFRLWSADASMLTGISNVPFQVAGLMLGGAFISRYMPSPKEISHWNAIVTALKIVGLSVMAFLGCNANKIDVSFLNGGNNSTLAKHCSADCDCKIGPVLPLCDLYSSTTYYSPCHAGCEKMTNLTKFSQCSCLPNENEILLEGFCPSDNCSNGLIAFLVFLCLLQFLNGSCVVGRMLLSYKSLQADQRSNIIGFTLILLSIFAIIPSPIVFGSLFESACLVRENMCDPDGSQLGNCWLYDENSLRFAYYLSSAAILVIAFIFDTILWKTRDVSDLRIYDGELRQLTSRAHSSSAHRNDGSSFATVSLS